MEQNEITTSGAPNPLLTNDLLTNKQPSNVSHVSADIPNPSRLVAGSSSQLHISTIALFSALVVSFFIQLHLVDFSELFGQSKGPRSQS